MRRSNLNIYEPTRQSIAAIAILIVKFIRRMISAFWPIILVFVLRRDVGQDAWWQIGIFIIGGFSLLGSILSYFKYYFHVTEDEIIISKGILKKTNLTIPFERVQSVDFEQNIIHQVLDVVKVKIDTAGSSSSELDIDALELPVAEQLRSIVIGYQKTHRTDIAENLIKVENEEERPILKVDIPELVKVGISQNHLKTAGLILAFVGATFNEIEQAFSGVISAQIDQLDVTESLQGQGTWWVGLIAIIVVFIFISFLLTLLLTVIRYYDLRVTRSDKGFKLVAGLFNRKEISAVHKKVQIVRWDYNPLQKILGLFRVNILQAAPELSARKPRFLLPGIYDFQLSQFIEEYFPRKVLGSFQRFKVHPWMIYRLTLFYGIIPGSIGILIASYSENTWFYFAALLIPIMLIWSFFYQRNWLLEINDHCLKTTSGVLGKNFNLLHLYKVQSIDLSQSWFERRRSLAHLNIHTAGGSVVIPYLDLQSAQDIKDYMLYHVEKSRRKWM